MPGTNFRLEPHPGGAPAKDLRITGRVERRIGEVRLDLLLKPLGEILIPQPAENPVRRNGLWEETCFELFLAAKDSPSYWEFNLSPAGHWNAYRFSGYRLDMHEEESFESLPFTIRIKGESFSLSAQFDLDPLVARGQDLEAGLSTVARLKSGETTYWALAHSGTKPDFHRRESFIIRL